MIIGLWHPGSGLGDQLFCYLAARITAERLGVPFTMVGKFKGESFMALDYGLLTAVPHTIEYPAGKIVVQNGMPLFEGKQWYDPAFEFIGDNTIVDGCMMQDLRYFGHAIAIRDWITVDRLAVADDTCIIGFRGGEYSLFPELFLPKEWWNSAIAEMRKVNPQMQFHVVTDDPTLAKQFFPDFTVTHEIGMDWKKVRFAKYAIIANSAFYILPRLLNEKEGITLAPKYWARHNIGAWAMPQNYYPKFTYL